MAESIEMPFGLWAQIGPRNHMLDGSPDPPCEWGNFGGKERPLYNIGTLCRELCKKAELIDLLFGLWTWVGRRKQKFNHVCHVAQMCPPMRAHWRHLASTIELSVYGGDAALFQITLPTCS